jgi:hypothetical protein
MSASNPQERFQRAISEIDAMNAHDPRQELDGNTPVPREVLYAKRMTDCLGRIYPEASETLQLAARAQHICRWQIARESYPLGREGYNAWRAACRDHHATLTREILQRCGYDEPEIARVAKIIRKEELKRDAESQALENVVGVVFAAHYLGAFAEAHQDYSEDKLLGILRKTLRKMDGTGHAALKALDLPAPLQRLLDVAMQGAA